MIHVCNRCGKRFASQASVRNHQKQLSSKCWKTYSLLLLDLQQQSHIETKGDPSSSLSLPSSPSESTPPPLDVDMDSPPPTPSSLPMEIVNDIDQPPQLEQEAVLPSFHTELFLGSSKVFGNGETYLDLFNEDEYADARQTNLYYPFASKPEWELASFLLKSDLSRVAIDQFLKLQLIQGIGISFKTAKDLGNRAEILPTFKPHLRESHPGQDLQRVSNSRQGLRWISKKINPESPTKNDVILYYRDPLLCLQYLMHSPLVQDHISFSPFKLYENAAKTMRIYTEWLSGDRAWNIQTQLGRGATLLGVILSSDKTNISVMTGGRSAHPLLISLANISMEYRNKDFNNSYLLLALLPIPKFIHHKRAIRGMLEARLYHHCLDVVLAPLKAAAQLGVMLSDPLGNLRWCFTPLASFIVDTPEAQLISCVGGKTSPVTMANYQQFGDCFRHPSRTGSITLNTINKIRKSANAQEFLETYEKAAKSYRLNGVQFPFWRDWTLSSDPSSFLTSEPLHHWHKQFWDHDTKWCIYMLGAAEIDFRFSALHNRSGYRHFKEGISSLKQVTGREQRDIQRYIIVVIADAVPPQFLVAIRALLDFRYFAQSPVINEQVCQNIIDALSLFHQHKEAILDSGARRGKNGKINNWHIPKLELFQSVASNIRLNGAACQWSADFTEHAHIKVVKEPGRSSNNHSYEAQICRYLDRLEKIRNFNLFTSICEAGVQFGALKAMEEAEEEDGEELRDDFIVSTTSELLPFLWTSGYDTETSRVPDYFHTADLVKKGLSGLSRGSQTPLQPPRTYQCAENIVYHLIRDPAYSKKTIAEVAELYNIPDLPAAIGSFILHITSDPTKSHIDSVGGRRRIYHDSLPVSHLQIWKKVRIQTTSYHHPHNKLVPYTINAAPPSSAWPYGQFDSAVFNIDPSKKWPQSGLLGHTVVDLCLIFRIMPSAHPFTAETLPGHQITCQFLAYARRYDILPQRDPANHTRQGMFPDPNTSLFLLKRATRSNGEMAGDIIPLNQLRSLVDLAPRFGKKANPRLTNANSLSFATEFWLNKYFDKELFYSLS